MDRQPVVEGKPWMAFGEAGDGVLLQLRDERRERIRRDRRGRGISGS
ncbi:MAG TPA: hypothetical protein VFJ07_18340 [Streptosporangiaceae bacterium]|nr:hypothetical protein [Streptosporangiaceae bacterium]